MQLFALAYNLANFLRQLALPRPVRTLSLTTLREKLIKIGAKVVHHARAVTFQLAEVAVPRELFAQFIPDGDVARLARELPAKMASEFTGTMQLLRNPAFQDLLNDRA